MNKDLVQDRYGRYFQIPKDLSEKGNEVTIICLDYHSHRYKKPELQKDGSLTIISHTTGKGSRLIDLLRYLRSVKNYLKANRPDVLIGCSDALQIILTAHLSRIFKIRLVLDLYDNYEAYALTQLPFIKMLYKKAIKTADAIAVISAELEEYINRLNPSGMTRVIGNAVDAGFNTGLDKSESRNILKLPQQGILVGTAGELSRKRGVDVLIKAFNFLLSETKNYYLVLAGKLERGVLPVTSAARVIYLGELDYKLIPVLFRALDVGVVYNLNDKFGNYCHPQKACEMIACQLPFVAANVGYMSRILKLTPDLLFKPGDYENLANAIKYQAQQKLISNIAINTWQQQADSLYQLLEQVVIN